MNSETIQHDTETIQDEDPNRFFWYFIYLSITFVSALPLFGLRLSDFGINYFHYKIIPFHLRVFNPPHKVRKLHQRFPEYKKKDNKKMKMGY